VLEQEGGELVDRRVRQWRVERSHGEHVHLAPLDRLAGLVPVVGQVPVLGDARAADPLDPRERVPVDPGGPGDLVEGLGAGDVEAVARDEDLLAHRPG